MRRSAQVFQPVGGWEQIRGKRVLVIEDGPTVTHGEMTCGAGVIDARKYVAAAIIDPREYAVGSIAAIFEKYNHLSTALPAMEYGAMQIRGPEATTRPLTATSSSWPRPSTAPGGEVQQAGRPCAV